MLELITDNVPFESVGGSVQDPESLFLKCHIPDTEYARNALKTIDNAAFVDGLSFRNRLGEVQGKMFLSTGCKIALLCSIYPDRIIYGLECGYNARDYIICNCESGKLALLNPCGYVSPCGHPICVKHNSKLYTQVSDLNEDVFQ